MQYDKSFFINRRALTSTSAEKILDILWQHLQPKTVFDIGCGTGIWLAECKKIGATKITGFDGPWVPLEELEINKDEFIKGNLENISINVEKSDLAICIELAEHLTPESGDKLIDFLTSHADLVLFSAAIPGQGGTGHINEREQSYWYKKFLLAGFECFDLIRPQIWTDENVNVIYKQNILLYARKESIAFNTLIKNNVSTISAYSHFELDRIHPDLFKLKLPKPKKKNKLRKILSHLIQSKD